MTRQAIRGLVLLVLLTAATGSTLRAQNADVVYVRDRATGVPKEVRGQYVVGPAGFQVIGGDKKGTPVNPDDVVRTAIGDLPGIDRGVINSLNTRDENNAKNDKKDFAGAREAYQKALKETPGAPERTKRYLEYKMIWNSNKVVDELDVEKGWKEKAEEVVTAWRGYLAEYKTGWELWPAVRASTRVQVELGKFEGAAATWSKITDNKDMPETAKLEAKLQEIDLYIRGTKYSNAAVIAGGLLKTATGAEKQRLVIYELAAKTGGDKAQALDAINKIKAEMDKTKDASVHATGFSMVGELYLAAGQPRDAMWAFLWVETVLNQDRDEVFKAVVRLTLLFETAKEVADEDQARKYRDKLKRIRTSF